ncbi:uncharacterized protein UV8b_00548 [Ustilaginoidea virens]|uniref:Uncharacterized protein n=1 Tax=Ustilaginoidea virens TaxID=1159556 RepID=A0A8E5ME71_USTVR|nr:uncharacterized protein UV8b_00548 [Ustilaginoidea virens]QUC16307.1 hypothetical protein UV8b_00548 [Ustilaginoidea virens]
MLQNNFSWIAATGQNMPPGIDGQSCMSRGRDYLSKAYKENRSDMANSWPSLMRQERADRWFFDQGDGHEPRATSHEPRATSHEPRATSHE